MPTPCHSSGFWSLWRWPEILVDRLQEGLKKKEVTDLDTMPCPYKGLCRVRSIFIGMISRPASPGWTRSSCSRRSAEDSDAKIFCDSPRVTRLVSDQVGFEPRSFGFQS